MYTELTNWLLLHCFQGRGYEGDGGVMSHDLECKKCRIKVFVMFCYRDGKNGSLSHFADVGPGLGNFSKYRGMQQQPNIQSEFHKRWRKKWPWLGTKSNDRTLCFFLGIPIHVEILYDSKKLVWVSLFKKNFFYIYIELRRWENTSGNRLKLGILWGFSNMH